MLSSKSHLNAYKEKQMRRRINTLITKSKIDSYDAYVELIKKDKAKFEQFINFLTINVSEIFKNTGAVEDFGKGGFSKADPNAWKVAERYGALRVPRETSRIRW